MKNKKYLLIIIILILVLALGLGVTYAWYTWNSSEEDETVLITTGSKVSATVVYNGGSDIEGAKLLPTETKEEGVIKEVTIKAKEESLFTLTFNLYLDIDVLPDELKEESFIYEIYKDNVLVKQGNFSQTYLDSNLVECTTNSTNHIVLIENDTITTTKSTYTLYLWIDGNKDTPIDMSGKLFEFKLHASGDNATVEEPPTLVEYISDLYNDAEKSTITNNSIVYNRANIYDTDDDDTTSGGLMNDRLGGTTTDYDAGNIRYYGKNPSNYIDIDDTELDSNGNEITTLYRIIGIFKDITVVNDDGTTETKDLVKVIRNDSIGDYSWDNKSNGIGTSLSNSSYGSNNWADSRLMMLLNPGYDKYNENNSLTDNEGDVIYGYEGSLYWNSKSGTCYSGDTSNTVKSSCDFKTNEIGLSEKAKEKIVSVVWYLRGNDTSSVYSNVMYNYERTTGSVFNTTRATEWRGKIGLMYPSDYGYATDLNSSVCSTTLDSYNNSTNSYGCRANDWLYDNVNVNRWTLSPHSSSSVYVFYVSSSGILSKHFASSTFGVMPVFYLDSELTIESGDGSSGNPYRLS